MSRRRNLAAGAVLLALIVGYVEPLPVSAQGGDAVFNSLRVAERIQRQYLEPQGLQDADYDLLAADFSTMSPTYVALLSASVTVGEAGDAVLIQVVGRVVHRPSPLYIMDDSSNGLWRLDNPAAPAGAVLQGAFPAGLSGPNGITSHGGSLYIVDGGDDGLWRLDNPAAPAGAVLQGAFPAGLSGPNGIMSHGGSLYIVDFSGRELWRLDNPAAPAGAVLQGAFPAGLSSPSGITSHGGSFYIMDDAGNGLWHLDDLAGPAGAVLQGTVPAGLSRPNGIMSHGGSLYIVDFSGRELWRLDNPAAPAGAVLQGAFPAGLSSPSGITSYGADCMVRLARGATEIKALSFAQGSIIFGTTFTDAPPAGTHTYTLGMKTMGSDASCTARVSGAGVIPSMLVLSYYAGVVVP